MWKGDVYKKLPIFENEEFELRGIEAEDAVDLLEVYSDELSLPLFNSDNCHGDKFYYNTLEKMQSAMDFWEESYRNGWFVRWSVVDKRKSKAIGTIECFHRDAKDYFTNTGLLRLDLKSEYEESEHIRAILELIVEAISEMFCCKRIATKAIASASERRKALRSLGFELCSECLIGEDGTTYGDYFVLDK